jgi:hypothetical protein
MGGGFLGIFRDSVNASSKDGGISETVKSEESYWLASSDFTTKVKGKNSSSYNHAIIDTGFYKAAIAIAVHVHNNYYHIFAKMALNYITIVINNDVVFKVCATAIGATWDDFDYID